MNDILIGYTVTLTFIAVISGLLCVYRYFLGDRLVEQSKKLKNQIAKIRQDYPELGEIRGKAVAGAIGEIGIEGILDELGIDPKLLNNPLVKGLIDKYAPKLLERLNNDAKSKSQETNLL